MLAEKGAVVIKQRDAEISRLKILKEAEKQFALAGLGGASVNIIAENAGLNKRMLYHYFGSKEGLYKEVLKKNFEKIYEMGKDAFLNTDDVVGSIRKMIHEYFFFLRDNPDYVKIIAREELSGGRYILDLIPDILMVGFEKLADLYAQGVREGLFKKDQDIMQLIISINALCFMTFTRVEILKDIWGAEFSAKLEGRLEHICELVLAGILV